MVTQEISDRNRLIHEAIIDDLIIKQLWKSRLHFYSTLMPIHFILDGEVLLEPICYEDHPQLVAIDQQIQDRIREIQSFYK